MNLFHELKRRNVLRAATAYIVASWLIIQVVETVFPAFGFGDSAVRITVIVMAVGFVPAVALAWAFELTPSGLKHERDVDYSSPAFKQFGKRLDRIIMVVLALALGLFAFDKFVLSESREAAIAQSAREEGRGEALVESYGDKSIAVLPFTDMSAEGDQEYMSDGIAEELLNLLARVPDLRVISRSSAFAFKGQDLEIPEIAKRLSVTYVLEGSVRKAQDRIRITTQLIDARSDTHLWSETYDREMANVFDIQDDVAASVVNELKIKLLGDAPRVRQTDPRAYELYLQAKFFIGWVATRESTLQSIDLLQQALAIDPTYVEAWTFLYVAYGNSTKYYCQDDPQKCDDAIAKSREALQRAYALDPEDPQILAYIGGDKLLYDHDAHGAALYLRRALELDPTNWMVMEEAVHLLVFLGRYDEAVAVQEYLLWREPLNVIIRQNLMGRYMDAQRFEDDLLIAEAMLEERPDDQGSVVHVVICKLMTGDVQGALADADMLEDPLLQLASRAIAYHLLDRVDESEAAIAELAKLSESVSYGVDVLAQVYTEVGDADAAFECLNRMADDGTIRDMRYNEPDFIKLHKDPRWAQLMEKLGISRDHYADIDFKVDIPSRTRAF